MPLDTIFVHPTTLNMKPSTMMCHTELRRILMVLAMVTGAQSGSYSQVQPNGQLDDLFELTTPLPVDFVMPDSTRLRTDVYLPITRDSLVVPVSIGVPGFLQGVFNAASIDYQFELIGRNVQFLIYDSIYDCNSGLVLPNPNPYQLPLVLSRTPYSKGPGTSVEGAVFSLLGYAFALQDMRGRYTSDGVYFPLITDSWNKNAVHPGYVHALDALDAADPRSSSRNEDGYQSVEFVKRHLKRWYDMDGNGIPETEGLIYNGRIAMFGASALGYNQYQAAAAHRINSNEPGLKALFAIVAPMEFYKSTAFQNGVMRHGLVTGWLRGQIYSGTDDSQIPLDEGPSDAIHSSSDWDLPRTLAINGVDRTYDMNMFDAAELAVDHFTSLRYPDGEGGLSLAGLYPRSPGRLEMDASRAMVDANGESVTKGRTVNGVVIDVPDSDPEGILGFGSTPRPGLVQSRYTNMEVGAYHLSGWYDIFTDGQLETWAYMRKHLSSDLPSRGLQKIVIGPWAHQTIGQLTTGDRTYPENVSDVLGIDFESFNSGSLDIGAAARSEVLAWYRYNLNYRCDGNGFEYREPVFILPPSNNPTVIASAEIPFAGTAFLRLRVPADTVRLPFEDLLRVLAGQQSVTGISAELSWEVPLLGNGSTGITLPPIPLPALIPGLGGGAINGIPVRDFSDPADVPNVRFYVIGPNDDPHASNALLGSYWLATDSFPLAEGGPNDPVHRRLLYLHQDSVLSYLPPTTDEGAVSYVHDPDDPVRTIGGSNMLERTPDGVRDSQGQFDLANPLYASTTMDREGVIQFMTEPITEDSLSIVGFPRARLWASSSIPGVPDGPTDTDFFVRIVDVYPDGREYFVQEGAVNARARDYAKALVHDIAGDMEYPHPVDDIPFTNIAIGDVVEYEFNLLPIAYTFGVDHRIKVLISSSNYERYQVNPNLPINPGEFFRREPDDGQSYLFNGTAMSPRVAVNAIQISPDHPSHISLPVLGPEVEFPTSAAGTPAVESGMLLFPNPTNGGLSVYVNGPEVYGLALLDVSGAQVAIGAAFRERTTLDLTDLAPGVYFVELRGQESGQRLVQRMVRW
jgi:predicted acyl esterase